MCVLHAAFQIANLRINETRKVRAYLTLRLHQVSQKKAQEPGLEIVEFYGVRSAGRAERSCTGGHVEFAAVANA